MADYGTLIAKSKELAAAGRIDDAKRVAQIALQFAPPEGGVSTNTQAVNEFGKKAKAMAAGGVDMATLGLADEATGLVGGVMAAPGAGTFSEGYAQSRDAVRDEHSRLQGDEPGPYGAGQAMGALATLGMPAARVLRGENATAKAANAAIDGAIVGGVYGGASAEGGLEPRLEQSLLGASLGGGAGLTARTAGAGIQKHLDNRANKSAIKKLIKDAPTTEQRMAEGRRLYDEVDAAGVQISPDAFDATRQKILESLRANTGFDELPGAGSLTPNSARVMGIMDEASSRMASEPTAALPFKSLDQMRRQAGAAAGNVTNKADQKAGMEIISGLDDFVNTMDDGAVMAGDRQALQAAIPQARKEWASGLKSQKIDDAIAGSEDYLSGSASGIRNEFKKLLKGKNANSFSDADKAVIRQSIRGSAPEQMLNLLGGGLGQLGQVGVGLGMGGPMGAVAGAGGAALTRKLSEAIMQKNAEKVRKIMAAGGAPEKVTSKEGARKLIEEMLGRALAVQAQ